MTKECKLQKMEVSLYLLKSVLGGLLSISPRVFAGEYLLICVELDWQRSEGIAIVPHNVGLHSHTNMVP
jgi:hypothetical protein